MELAPGKVFQNCSLGEVLHLQGSVEITHKFLAGRAGEIKAPSSVKETEGTEEEAERRKIHQAWRNLSLRKEEVTLVETDARQTDRIAVGNKIRSETNPI